MSLLRVALVQMNSTGDSEANRRRACELVAGAAEGADLVATPEVTNLIAPNREALFAGLHEEADDPCLADLRALALQRGVFVLIGSLALKAEGEDGRAVNRGVLVAPDGEIAARYDKIHMFEADLGEQGKFREAASYRPGERAVLAQIGEATLGLGICYDMRFPQLYRALAKAGAQVLTAPSAFTVPTGRAHWHTLLRARAIENGCFMLAPAQWGPHHGEDEASLRESYGHSLVVSPWGEVLADAGDGEGIVRATLDLAEVDKARKRVPSLANDRDWSGPTG